MQELRGAGTFSALTGGQSTQWTEHLRVPDLSVGTYCIGRGGHDGQEAHTEDEIYLVTGGQATLEAGGQSVTVGPGSVLYVPAGEAHRFTGITQDLSVVVVFAPAEYSRHQGGR